MKTIYINYLSNIEWWEVSCKLAAISIFSPIKIYEIIMHMNHAFRLPEYTIENNIEGIVRKAQIHSVSLYESFLNFIYENPNFEIRVL